MNAPRTAEIDERVGAVIGGRYRVLEPLGAGGMGAVYLAEHLELGRQVALKLLVPELARNRTAVERFLREARTASAIGHPNIVDVFDLGRDNDGVPYLAMERLEGRDLSDELYEANGPLPAERVLELLAPIASALDVCHERGVIHRDLKPSNVFLAKLLDGSERPKLVDFGLAMLYSSDERLTRTGFFAGTPEYMSPEAARGDLAGPSGDIYALATMAYEMLCGQVPFDAELPNGILVQKLTEDPLPMGVLTKRRFPGALERAVAHGLAADAEDRPPTARAFVDGIRAALEGVDLDGVGVRVAALGTDAEDLAPNGATRRRGGTAQAPDLSEARPTPAADPVPSPPRSGEQAIARTDDAPVPPPPARRGPLVALGLGALLLVAAPVGYWALVDEGSGAPVAATVDPEEPEEAVADPDPGETEAPAATAPEAEPTGIEEEPTPPPAVAVPDAPSTRRGRRGRSTRASDTEARTEADPRTEAGSPAGSASAPEAPPSEEAAPTPEGAGDPTPEAPPERDRATAERLTATARSLVIRGDHAGGLRLLTRARAADPTYPAIYRVEGLAHQGAGRAAAARRAYERYLRMEPNGDGAARVRRALEGL